MLECLKFIFKLVIQFLEMLFEVDVGFTSLGTMMCITFIFLPIILSLVNFLKHVGGDASLLTYFHNTKGSDK